MREKDKLSFIKSRLKQGWSYHKIGEVFGVSRQRIHQILVKNGLKVKTSQERLREKYESIITIYKEINEEDKENQIEIPSFKEWLEGRERWRNTYRPLTWKEKREVFERDNFFCQYCGLKDIRKLVVDHKLPRSRGGTHVLDNLITACGKCNNKKVNKTYEEFINNEKIKVSA